eukprot:m.48394 g.48394  ORF g.48394 m.48394 type:complete len:319 (+) comp14956_c0_seq1:188-1144(+)
MPLKPPHGVEVEYSPTETADLFQPPAEEVAAVLQKALATNFAEAQAEVVDCPDLSQAPFHLAAPGICGTPKLLDIGGVPNLVPLVQRNRVYNLQDICRDIGMPDAFIIGAGAASSRLVGCNAELMPNTNLGTRNIQTTYSKVLPDGSGHLCHYSSNEVSLLLNVLASQGLQGKVIKVTASKRTGDGNLVSVMRKGLGDAFGSKPVGLGGAFLIKKGQAKIHIMPDFSSTPLESDAAVDKWLRYYEYKAPLVCLSVFISKDPGLDLRVEHTHCFSQHGEGGHYHYDLTPDGVEYEGYFVVAEQMVRVDRPKATHNVGRD